MCLKMLKTQPLACITSPVDKLEELKFMCKEMCLYSRNESNDQQHHQHQQWTASSLCTRRNSKCNKNNFQLKWRGERDCTVVYFHFSLFGLQNFWIQIRNAWHKMNHFFFNLSCLRSNGIKLRHLTISSRSCFQFYFVCFICGWVSFEF